HTKIEEKRGWRTVLSVQWLAVSLLTSVILIAPLAGARILQGAHPSPASPVLSVTPGLPESVNLPSPTATPFRGFAWRLVDSPNPGPYDSVLKGLAVLSDRDVWAVGYTNNESGLNLTHIQHWDGTQWSVVPSPNVGS